MSRAARTRRVFFVEEPERRGSAALVEAVSRDGLTIVRPVLPTGISDVEATATLRQELDRLLASEGVERPWLWYYTPMALPWTRHVDAEAVVYDCMDELSGFRFAPPELVGLERELLSRADVVFTGGQSLYEAKRDRHPNVFAFPSSVDGAHFRQARNGLADPPDQADIARPRVGYFGVIDERIDLDLIRHTAAARPDWQLVMVGPTAKVSDDDLPRAENIHWLGIKGYDELPAYLAGWDVAVMPFAMNDSTRHISPTKTPEYLCGGRPVVSTPIRDVVRPYGAEGLVRIAADAPTFVAAIEEALASDRTSLLARADRFLATQSWDATWAQMEQLANELTRPRAQAVTPPRSVSAPEGALVPAAADASAQRPAGRSSASSLRSRPR
jgi:UDP-galactopyranose mutase